MKRFFAFTLLLSSFLTFAETTIDIIARYDGKIKDGDSHEYFYADVYLTDGSKCPYYSTFDSVINSVKCNVLNDYSNIEKVVIKMNCKDMTNCDGVYLDYVAVAQNQQYHKAFKIYSKRWIDELADDRALTRTLYPSHHPDFDLYNIEILTSTQEKAGTDARVKMDFYGENGKKLIGYQPDSAENNFEKGAFENFELPTLNLGKISKVCIYQDGTGSNPEWLPESIEIRSKKTGDLFRLKGLGAYIKTTKSCFNVE